MSVFRYCGARFFSRVWPAVFVLALLLVVMVGRASAQPSATPFEIVPGSFHFTTSSSQAGAHADWTTAFDIKHNALGRTFNDVKNTVVELPPGYIGSNTAVPTCTAAQLLSNGQGEGKGPLCPAASQVGTISLAITINTHAIRAKFPVFNMEVTTPGVAAELGFNALGTIVQTLPITVRPGDMGLTVVSPNINGFNEPHEISVTVWGVPAAHSHDRERGEECIAYTPEEKGNSSEPECINGDKTVNIAVEPFLTNPTSCEAKLARMRSDSWEEPGAWSNAEAAVAGAGECDRVPFDPSLEVLPTTDSVESPTGLDLSLVVPQAWERPETLSTSYLEDAQVTLPVGYTVNPSAGAGLAACTVGDLERETFSSPPGAGCPSEATLGTVEIETPVLAEKITGSVYIAKPFENPFDSLLAIYVVAKDPARGVLVKVAGKVQPDPVTGQLVTTFDSNPQVPFSKFTFKFRQGATSPLVSPPTCGSYTVHGELTPWSAPLEPRLVSNAFQIEHGIDGGPCPTGGIPPFHPQVISGTNDNDGGSYSPFYLRILREDGEQELTRFSTTLPPGLTGNLSGIPFCPEASIEAAKNVTGAQEETNPSCPQASEIGHTIVSAGVGSVLAQTPGKVYLAGPYHGAPLSIVSITSAKVGPFDLGTVVIRFALDINPTTAQVEVSANGSDPIPHIIDGIIVHVREIRVYINRNQFILNPTNCDPLSITDTIDGAGADPANPADQVPTGVNTPFQAADCTNLTLKPAFSVTTSGKTSKANGASLTAKLTIPAPLGTQSNIRQVKVDLPKQLPSRLTTLQKACTAAQFNTNPAGCPAASFIGHAKAITAILPVPLEGPAIFVSHGGEAFPSLEIVLQGYGITIDLVGSTFISKAGITSSTFKTVPDQPVTSFALTLPEGKFSALAANGNLCTSKLAMPTEFVGQNGDVIHQSTPVSVTGCPKKKTLTRAQKLTAGLKACKKKAKSKRPACEKAARKQFDSQARKKSKGKSKA